ncbi:YoaK family protein [Lachnoclostridium edouardi]|uniref:YoaK family protein n=1 Tax=Lachnoclostridium edouardi TaxID=1926283 RepID=UPI001FA8F789|nr:YoaK family protein [Lachnoclostridium edouardi]
MNGQKGKQMSESLRIGLILAAAGGFLDAYTYISRGGVFANAQTGNIVLLGVNAADKQWGRVVQYLIPIAAFAVGVFAAEQIKWHFKERKEIHWRQLTVLLEIVILAAVAFMPKELNWLANTAVSFACAVQVESFRKVRGSAFATTMCTGNLRSGTELLGNYLRTGDRELGKKSIKYYGIILSFIVGAGGGYLITEIMGIQAVLVCCALLAICFAMMFCDGEKKLEKGLQNRMCNVK